MAIPNSSNSTYGFSDQFPAGLRVLVVDDDSLCLKILEKMLRKRLYKVTTFNRVEIALTFLRDKKNNFDIVLSDVYMPGTNGFKLLEQIELEMDLPVIMMSTDDSKNVVMKGVTRGSCDFLINPVEIEALENIWQHVIRKKKDFDQSSGVEDEEQNIDNSSSVNKVVMKKKSGRRDEEEDEVDKYTPKKQRIVWSLELHQRFVAVVNQLPVAEAVPSKILELMNVPELRRANVASHLQKYRQFLSNRRYLNTSSSDSQPQNYNEINNSPYNESSNTNFETMSSFHGIDFQAQPTGLLIPGDHSLAAVQSPISIWDQGNMFRLERLNLGYCEGDQMNLLHGIQTTMNQSNISGSPLLNELSGIGLTRGVSSTLCNPSVVDFSPIYDNRRLQVRGVSSTIYNPSVVDFSPLYDNSFPNTRNIRGASSLSLQVPSYRELQGYDGIGDGFNPDFGMQSDLDTQFTVESSQDSSCFNNLCPENLDEDDIMFNTLLEQKNVFESEFGFDTFPPSNNLLA